MESDGYAELHNIFPSCFLISCLQSNEAQAFIFNSVQLIASRLIVLSVADFLTAVQKHDPIMKEVLIAFSSWVSGLGSRTKTWRGSFSVVSKLIFEVNIH